MNFEYKKSIISYYDNTRLDYWALWFRHRNRSVHFGYYDNSVSSHHEALLNLNQVMADKIGIGNGDVILDAGCGQGESSLWLARHYQVGVEGITLVPHQVEIAGKEAGKRKILGKVNFSEQDYTSTQFADETFSVVWACESMCHAYQKADFYKEAFRLLKPGGRIICADYFRTNRPLAANGENLLHSWLKGWSINDIDTRDEHLKNATQAGFINFELSDITQYTKPSLRNLHSVASRLWGLGKILRFFGLRNDVNHGNHFASIKQYEALEKNLWFYGLLSMKKPA